MFGKFTKGAKSVVIGALHSAEESEASQVAEEHVLLALLDQSDSRAAVLLAGYDVPKDDVRNAYRAAAKSGGMSKADSDALRELGIDVDAIVASIRREHGENALAAGASAGRRRGGRTRGFAEDVRKVLAGAHREAVKLGDQHLGDEHLQLALLAGGSLATDALGAHGVTYDEVRDKIAQLRDR